MLSKDEIITQLKSKKEEIHSLGVKNIGLFGSYAHNKNTDTSDIDILIDFENERENFDNFMGIYDLLEKLFSKNRVDIVTKNGLSPYIGRSILNEVIYV